MTGLGLGLYMINEKAYNACTILKHGGGIHIHHGNDAGYIRKDTLFLKGVHNHGVWCTIAHHHNSATKSLGLIYSIFKICQVYITALENDVVMRR
jgi:hypothetical protein